MSHTSPVKPIEAARLREVEELIAAVPIAEQILIDQCAQEIRALVKGFHHAGVMALILVAAELHAQ